MQMRPLTVLVLILFGVPPASAADYLADVKPIFLRRCASCHGALTSEAGLRLDASGLLLRGGDNGAVVSPGKPDESLLYKAITGAEDVERMPAEGESLTADEVALVRTWIADGAKVVDEPIPPDPRAHWAFRAPQRPALPTVRDSPWVRNPVDAFVAAEHEARQLDRAEPADARTLLRRIYLDLVGLPPTPQQAEEFLADSSPDAYERVVDRLLASPQYGERWGRHWMDVWRYSDWDGHGEEIRNSQRHIWRWRDWIVESLNANMPYDRMIVAMLAADEATPTDTSALRATGFLARNWYKFNRDTWLESTIEHTSKAFLGLTINCARCHDHKYDPIAQTDYYRFRAFFEPYDVRMDRVPGQADVLKDGLPRVYDANAAALTHVYERGNVKEPIKDQPVSPGLPSVVPHSSLEIKPVGLPPVGYYPGLQEFIQRETKSDADAEVAKSEGVLAEAEQQLATARQQIESLSSGKSSRPNIISPVLADNFDKPRPELWRTEGGSWSFEPAPLKQLSAGETFARLVSLANHPANFVAEFRFRITGGERWQSVGLNFDYVDDQNWQAVYLSAVESGPKVLHFFRKAGQDVNPPESTIDYPIRLNEEYRLTVAVRGQQIAVWVNDQQILLQDAPQPRTAGKFAVWTFDATAELLSASVAPLPVDLPLLPPRAQVQARFDLASASVEQARRRLAQSRAQVEWIGRRIAADRFKYGDAAVADQSKGAALEAERCERTFNQRKAEADIAAARLEILKIEQSSKPAEEKTKLKQPHEQKLTELAKQLDAFKSQPEATEGKYSPLTAVYPSQSTGRRLALANWIVAKDNPLTARVAVNHVWMRHFGAPLVSSVFNFGNSGSEPTHRELLDWLAVELIESGWDMKGLHRMLVTSSAYRMASSRAHSAGNLAKDPDNRFLWRMNSRRVEAEIVRDSVLSVSGRLDLTMGGPDIDPKLGVSTPRRSLYFRHANEKRVAFLNAFDSASVQECYRRAETITPQQALALANSGLTLNESRRVAAKLSGTAGRETAEHSRAFVKLAFETILGRPAGEAEISAAEQYLVQQAGHFQSPEKLTKIGVDQPDMIAPSADPMQRARESLVHVLLNHHEFITIR